MIQRLRFPSTVSANFGYFWFSHSASLIALQFGTLALPILAIEHLHSSDSAIAVLTGLASLPWLVLGLFAGHIVDSSNRKRPLILTHGLRGVIILAMVTLAYLGLLSYPMLALAFLMTGSLEPVTYLSPSEGRGSPDAT